MWFKPPKKWYKSPEKVADVCLVLEGTYPYVRGGVSSWAHDLILNHPELTFHLVTITAPPYTTKRWYKIPSNVIGITNIRLQNLPRGRAYRDSDEELFAQMEIILNRFHYSANVTDLQELTALFEQQGADIGRRVLLDSPGAWEMIQRMYNNHFSGGSFLDYFWSWRCLFGGLFSLLLPEIPPARLYHTLCTGYAGVYAARAAFKTGSPMLVTEHGLYTNERRIELGTAEWFHDVERLNLSTQATKIELRDFWENAFASYSQICYQAADRIVSLFQENSLAQTIEGADPARQLVIPNGVNLERFADVRTSPATPHVVATIGRIVPIKGIKCFIQAAKLILDQYPDTILLIIGPTEEDPLYYAECKAMVEQYDLTESILFTDSVDVKRFLAEINILVLTSLSEAQPLVILEAGAAGIPVVATDVGSCRELICGNPTERPNLGNGGLIARVSDASDVAEKVLRLLKDDTLRKQYGEALRSRVMTFYSSEKQHEAYRKLYQELLTGAFEGHEEMVA